MHRILNAPIGGNLGITGPLRKSVNASVAQTVWNSLQTLSETVPHTSNWSKYTHWDWNGTTRGFDIERFPRLSYADRHSGTIPSSPYKYVLTAIDVFTKYLFAVPLTTISAIPMAFAPVSIMFQHSYILQEILSQLRNAVVSDIFHELTQLLELKISHASLKYPQTSGVVERAHVALAKILETNSNQTFTNWNKYLNLATFIHNTSYHTSIGCAPTVIFHGGDPVKPLGIRLYSNSIQKSAFNNDFVETLRDEMLRKFQNTKETLGKTFNRYRRYHDQKAKANRLAAQTDCLLLKPRLTEQPGIGLKLI